VFTTGLRLDIFAKAYLNVKKNSLAQNTQSNGRLAENYKKSNISFNKVALEVAKWIPFGSSLHTIRDFCCKSMVYV
jgi:hypothetical protein